MDKALVLHQLFLRENDEPQLVDVNQTSLEVSDNQKYQSWLQGKRALELQDVADSRWIKTCTGGYITEVIFNANGTLEEYRLFDRFRTSGSWILRDGILSVEIRKGENRYTLNVVGNKIVNIHSAVEYKNDQLHSYLKLAPIKP
ncbi:hypothetical protein F0231_10205 [Vibrio sp. RE86]|uniref:hypothetical protein n=1 Tax=Vibrio sp. RE86 TaxID=2607605 RepID=UPI0014936BDF|nr:hypothetical protein [Vibrio sp. RE86]NOH80114.1 hypothetical protein [Vibrio sp. RE86]